MKTLAYKYATYFNLNWKDVYKLFYEIKNYNNCCDNICYIDLLYKKYKVSIDKYLIKKLIKRLYICDINKLFCN